MRQPGTPAAQAVAMVQAIALTITGALPVFLTGALAVQVRSDLAIGPAALGAASSVMFAVSGVSARYLGSVVQARGTRFGYAMSAGLGGLSLLTIAAAPTYAFVVLGLAIGGVGNAAGQPTANLLLTEAVGPRRLGLAMGIKQSYIPLASLVGGLSVPTIAVLLGWRWAIGFGAILCAAIALWGVTSVRTRTTAPTGDGTAPRRLPPRALLVLTVGGGASAAAATSLGVFLVDSGVAAGVSLSAAGYLLAGCSALSLGLRILFGWLVDRVQARSLYLFVAVLMLITVLGFALLGTGNHAVFLVGALTAYVGWTWTGVFHLAVVRGSVGAVAASTGYIQTGLALGAAAGPLTLGVIAETASYGAAWLVAAAVGLVGAVLVLHGRRLVRRAWGIGGAVTAGPGLGTP